MSLPGCLFLSPVTKWYFLSWTLSRYCIQALHPGGVSKMAAFPFLSICLTINSIQPVIISEHHYYNILYSAWVQFVLKISTFLGHCMGCASLYFLLPACSFLCHIYPNMLSCASQAIPVCIPPVASQNPKSTPSTPWECISPRVWCWKLPLLSSQGVWDVLCQHQHLPLALELQATMVIPSCFEHI